MAGGKKLRKLLIRFLVTVLSVLLLALLAAFLILAKPQEEKKEPVVVTPSAVSSPAVSIDRENDLARLVSGFPAPVMSFMSGSGMTFVSATSADTAYGGGFGRIATLYWQTSEGEPMTLMSIWPADALSLLEDGYHFMTGSSPTLFGNASVRMKNETTVRIHVATDQGLYVVLLPDSLSEQAAALCRSLQLFTAESDN